MFNCNVTYVPARRGERYASALTNISFNNKVIKKFGKISLKDYVTSFIKKKINMKIASSLKSLKKRDLNSKLVRRRGRVYIINKKKTQNLKRDRNK